MSPLPLGTGRRGIVLAALTGMLTGLAVAGFERVVASGLLERLFEAPLAVQAAAPLVGLALAALALHTVGHRTTPSTADEYIRNFHERDERLPLRPFTGRLLASVCTLGSGCAMGLEGPSTYIGASIGSSLQHRMSRFFSREDTKTLLVAGAAAGVAAIFKAPATGALFALEVPYKGDLARRMLLPALFAAATGYLVYVAINGTEPLFAIVSAPPLDARDLGAAIGVGLLAGIGARAFAAGVLAAKSVVARAHVVARVAAAGVGIGVLVVLSHVLTGQTLALGPGYRTIEWAADPRHAVGEILGLLVLRTAASLTAVAGGGAGGLFIPLVIEGALLGRLVAGVVGAHDPTLMIVLGVSAFLGAGYRVPLAAVMFVAESTGKPGFVVPGLLAAVASQLTMGPRTVSPYQRANRTGHLEQRLDLPVAAALQTDVRTAPPDATVAELVEQFLFGARLLTVPVVDGNRYVGTVHAADLTAVDRDRWATTTAAEVLTDAPVGDLRWDLRRALRALEEADSDQLVITDDDAYVGVVTTSDILRLDEVLELTDPSR